MDDQGGTPHHDPRYFTSPFILNTDSGRYLVLKAVKLCNVKTIDCMKQETSCVLKVEKPSPSCPSQESPKCFVQTPNKQNAQLRFINTGPLSSIFSSTTDRAAAAMN